ncbi:hypothetical protein GUJ93_ZPchr0010g7227 [Zizania palustris]|uniref:OVATE domain-containing protein n=1 Tax=Zizania palustris TaxID=103762 RepID=A0A8J5WA58_ZIZPA|nr:hypothetical protein GUJ93_ZPchr0010g7227 [Zizania palustris]
MVELVVENGVRAPEDLLDLLEWYLLSVNSREHHGVMMEVFMAIWIEILVLILLRLRIAKDSKYEIGKLAAMIEHTKSRTETLKFRIVTAKKMKEASYQGAERGGRQAWCLSSSPVTSSTSKAHLDLVKLAETHSSVMQLKLSTANTVITLSAAVAHDVLQRYDPPPRRTVHHRHGARARTCPAGEAVAEEELGLW